MFSVTGVKLTKQNNQANASDTSWGEERFHLVISYILWQRSNKVQACLFNHCGRGSEFCMQSKDKMGGTCSSIKVPVNYTVPRDVSARQHPRAMTELCGFSSRHRRDIKSVSVSPSFTSTGYPVSLMSWRQRPSALLPHWPTAPPEHLLPLLPHVPFPSPPSAGCRWSSQALTWATTNLFMVCYRRVGVLIQTAETTLTVQTTMGDHGGCRGMPKDAQDGGCLNPYFKYYRIQVPVCYCH